MNRFGLSRLDVTAPARQDAQPATPTVGETLFGIGVVLALHLAFAFGVVLVLRAFGVS